MGASRPYFLKVLRTKEDIVEVSAVTPEEAKEGAMEIPEVICVIEWGYSEEELT